MLQVWSEVCNTQLAHSSFSVEMARQVSSIMQFSLSPPPSTFSNHYACALNKIHSFETVPLLTHVEGDQVYFKDGTHKKIDAIILCTGYKHHFPFLEEKLDLKTESRLMPDSLHKGVFFHTNPRIMFLGMQDQWFTFNMFDAQAWLARDFMLGSFKLEDKAILDEEWKQWRAREETLVGDEANLRFQADYLDALIGLSDYPMYDVEACVQRFLEMEHNKHHNMMTFRSFSSFSFSSSSFS
jgi:trimethylamine monooxygenase